MVLSLLPLVGGGQKDVMSRCGESNYFPDSISELNLEPQYESQLANDDPPISGTIHDNDVITGDHVVINGTVTSTPIGSNVASMLLHIEAMDRIKFNTTEPLVIPNSSYDPYTGPINHSQFAWVIVKGLARGVKTHLFCDFTNTDVDLFGWPGHLDQIEYSYSNNLLSGGFGHPIVEVFIWEFENDTLVLGIFDYDLQPGEFYLEVEQEAEIVDIASEANWVAYDTYNFLRNITTLVIFEATLDLGLTYIYRFENVTFNNFFIPEVEILTPNGGEDWSVGTHRITWNASDLNSDDELWFRIRISQDGGYFWYLLGSGFFNWDGGNGWYYYDWHLTGWPDSRHCLFEVWAFDNDTVYAGGPNPMHENDTIDSFWPAFKATDRSDNIFRSDPQIDPPMPDPVTPTTLSHPEDIDIPVGDDSQKITWSVRASSPVTYTVYRNDTFILAGRIDWGLVEVPLVSLEEGHYIFKIHLSSAEEPMSDIVRVNVISSMPPRDIQGLDLIARLILPSGIGAALGLVILYFIVTFKDRER
ncbi:MAG: hypothetical protein ACXADC_09785 [Candidatus Thorarchaeota archaeon]|jgi:hypothetical protein